MRSSRPSSVGVTRTIFVGAEHFGQAGSKSKFGRYREGSDVAIVASRLRRELSAIDAWLGAVVDDHNHVGHVGANEARKLPELLKRPDTK